MNARIRHMFAVFATCLGTLSAQADETSLPVWTGGQVDWRKASAYEQAGLVAQWDGIDNAGTGEHVAATNRWKNLAPSDTNGVYDLTVNAYRTWGDSWLNVSGPSAMNANNLGNYGTIEILYRSNSHTASCVMFNGGNRNHWCAHTAPTDSQGYQLFFYSASQNSKVALDQGECDPELDRFVTVKYGSAATGAVASSIYTNGLQAAASAYKPTTAWNAGSGYVVLGDRTWSDKKSTTSKPWYGRIYAIRLYSSLLTPAQIANNALLDQARYHNDAAAIAEIEAKRFVVDEIPEQRLEGAACEPKVTVRDLYTGELLTQDKDYAVEYLNNTEAGTATAKVTGLGDYGIARDKTKETAFAIVGIWRVRQDATGTGRTWADASNWTNALLGAQAAAGTCEIWVSGDVTATNDVSYAFKKPLVIYGGFAGTEKDSSERPAGVRSVVDGLDKYNTFTFSNTGAMTLDSLYFTRGYQRGVRKEDSTGDLFVTNCAFNLNGKMGGTWNSNGKPGSSQGDSKPLKNHGCGANFIGKSSAKLTVVNCDFSGNMTCDQAYDTGSGGGACIANFAQATIDGCTFTTNHVVTRYRNGWSSALQLIATPARVTGCAFRGNAAPTPNGSVVNAYGACGGTVFENCLFTGNTCGKSYGSGQYYSYHTGAGEICFDMKSADTKASITNCTFAYNYARKSATLTVKQGDVDVHNTIFWANVSDSSSEYAKSCGTEIHCHTNGTVSADWILIGGTNEQYVSSLVTNAVHLGENVLTCDPLLVTPTAEYTNLMKVTTMPYTGWTKSQLDGLVFDPSRAAYNVHLRGRYVDELTGLEVKAGPRSPAVDAGDPADDCANEPKPNGERINLGCYGNTPWATRSKLPAFLLLVK